MKYINFLKNDKLYLKKKLFNLYIEKLNIINLLKYKKLNNFSLISKNKKDTARLIFILNKK